MATVTVGIPVYNGAAHLAGTLDCILGQTYRDLEILVFDNASTDETPRIIADYAARDPRVRHVRQPHNKGPVPNFGDVILAADSPYFLWRAADDRSDPNYIEVLLALLEAHPDKQLAVGRIVNTFEGKVVKTAEPLALKGDGGWSDQRRLMFDAHWSVLYGLWRRAEIARVMARIKDRYGEPASGWDFVALLPVFLEASVVETDATTFECVVRGVRLPKAERKRQPRQEADFDTMLQVRGRFLVLAQELGRDYFPAGPRRLFGMILIWAYANQRVYKFKRIVRRTLRRWAGLKP
ncbi:MAG: glycosyltransferase family 2 protein [Caulobacteraceae bacterium]|nr:glycosyltransferase family 2 protein [Caulobacteraceae bacterium]